MGAFRKDIIEAETERLAAYLDSRIPAGAAFASRPGVEAVAWRHEKRHGRSPPLSAYAILRRDGGESRVYFLGQGLALPTLLDAALDGTGTPHPVTWEAAGLWDERQAAEPAPNVRDPRPLAAGRRDGLRALAGGMDAMTVLTMRATGVGSPSNAHLLPSGGAGGVERHALSWAHPWATRLYSGLARSVEATTAEAGPDAGARLLLHHLDRDGARGAAMAALVARLRRTASPWSVVGGHQRAARLLAALPASMFPDHLPVTGPVRPSDLAGFEAFHALGPLVAHLARATGRDARSVAGRIGSWAGYLDALAARSGIAVPGPQVRARSAMEVAARLTEMACAMAVEVVAPAAMAVEGAWTGREGAYAPDRAVASLDPADHALAASWRLLLGAGTLPALAETCARWHREAGAISAAVAEIDAALPGNGLGGPRLFPDTDVAEGIYLTCLRTSRDLVDEGSAGPDADGVPGLDHCVGSYLAPVRRGEVAIVSVRRRVPGGYVRLSTAEVRFDAVSRSGLHHTAVDQHRGRRNADPPGDAGFALNMGLMKVQRQAREALAAHRETDDPGRGVAEAIHESGAWERMRDLWSFALTRPQRSMGPAELLRSAGYGAVAGDARAA